MGTTEKKIVFIYPGSVGAVLQLIPLANALRKAWPAVRCTLLTSPEIAPLARLVPQFDDIIVCDETKYKGMLGVPRLSELLKPYDFDIAFCLRTGERWAMAARLAGITRRLGYDTGHAGWFLTDKIPLPVRSERVRHEGLLSLLGIDIEEKLVELELPREVKENYWKVQDRYGLAGNDYIVICPFAGEPAKCLTQATASHLARHWHEKKRRVYLIGSFEQGEALEKIAKFANLPYTQVLAGKLSLPELTVFLSRAALLISVDAGPLYLAQTVNCPSVGVFGPTLPPEGRMFTRGTKILFKKADCAPCYEKQELCKNYYCLGNISALEIIRAAEE